MFGCCAPRGSHDPHRLDGDDRPSPESKLGLPGVYVDLGLSRASPWGEVVSFMPDAGRLTVKAAVRDTFFLRPPHWAPRDRVRLRRHEVGPGPLVRCPHPLRRSPRRGTDHHLSADRLHPPSWRPLEGLCPETPHDLPMAGEHGDLRRSGRDADSAVPRQAPRPPDRPVPGMKGTRPGLAKSPRDRGHYRVDPASRDRPQLKITIGKLGSVCVAGDRRIAVGTGLALDRCVGEALATGRRMTSGVVRFLEDCEHAVSYPHGKEAEHPDPVLPDRAGASRTPPGSSGRPAGADRGGALRCRPGRQLGPGPPLLAGRAPDPDRDPQARAGRVRGARSSRRCRDN